MQSKLAIILICSAVCFGLTYNQNGDCAVNFLDFAMMAADYNDTVDINDIAGLTGEWLEYEVSDTNRSPVISDQSGVQIAGTSKQFTISATDDESLTYQIHSVSNLAAGDVNGPYQLAGNTFTFDSNEAFEGNVQIIYSADDGTGLTTPCGGTSMGILSLQINYEPTPPTANDANAIVLQYVRQNIYLTASDDGFPEVPGKLKYIITDLPDDPNTILQDPRSGSGIIKSVPYTLNSGGSAVWYYADTAGLDSFSWKANDYGTDANSGDSNVVTIDVNVIANPKDSLYFDGTGGTVEFADSNYFDLIDGQAIDFWIRTNKPFQGICSKRQVDGKGWELNLVHGKPQFELYDENGLLVQARSWLRLDNGFWNECTLYLLHDVNGLKIYIASGLGQESQFGYSTNGYPEPFIFTDFNDPNVSFANDANLVFGSTSYGDFKGCIDKLRTFTGIVEPGGVTDIIQGLSPRTEDIDEVVLGFGKASTVLYMFDEGAGTSLIPVRGSTGNGTINDPDKIKWQPKMEVINDTSVKQYHKYMEKRKCTDNGF